MKRVRASVALPQPTHRRRPVKAPAGEVRSDRSALDCFGMSSKMLVIVDSTSPAASPVEVGDPVINEFSASEGNT